MQPKPTILIADDDESIRVVEFKLVCEDCYHDLPEAE